MSFCSKCGQKLEENSLFCPNCGQKIVTEQATNINVNTNSTPDTTPVNLQKVQSSDVQVNTNQEQNKKKNTGGFFSFTGRLNRLGYLWRIMLNGVCIVFFIAFLQDAFSSSKSGNLAEAFLISLVVILIIGVSSLSLSVRRCHDLNQSGWLALVSLIPFINVLFSIYLMFAKGTDGDNLYGPDPLRK